MTKKLCCYCNEPFEPSSGHQRYCHTCKGSKHSKRALVDASKHRPCSSCHQTFPPAMMVLDRGPLESRQPSIGDMIQNLAEAVLRERLALMPLLCLDCHRTLLSTRQRELESAMHKPAWTPPR